VPFPFVVIRELRETSAKSHSLDCPVHAAWGSG